MNSTQALRLGLNWADMLTKSYLEDLTDAELLVRPVPGTNHIAWQLGHLLKSEHDMITAICPGIMPALPDGFGDKYTADTSRLDSAGCFHTKSQYLDLYKALRAGTLAALEKFSDAELDQPVPEQFAAYTKNIGDLFALQGTHWLMHAGQWAIIRRKLGRKPLF